MTTREFEISELNHVLSLVHDTLQKETELTKLRQEVNKTKRIIADMKFELRDKSIVEEAAGFFLTQGDVSDAYKIVKDKNKSINNIIEQINVANELYKGVAEMINYGMINCYFNGGLLNPNEVREDYLYEYAYLIQNTSLTVYRLLNITPEVRYKLEEYFKHIRRKEGSRRQIREYIKLAIKFSRKS